MGILSFFSNLFKTREYVYHSSGKDAKFESNPRQWMLASDALLQKGDWNHIDILGGNIRTPWITKGIRYNLKRSWDILDREDLLKRVEHLKMHGSRWIETVDLDSWEKVPWLLSLYGTYKSEISSMKQELEELKDDGEYGSSVDNLEYLIQSVDTYGTNIEKNDFLAWDYIRAIHLLWWGYVAEFLTEDEAFDMMKPFAQKLQEQFDSWDEMSANYMAGRGYWDYDKIDQQFLEKDRQALLHDTESPWVQIGFKSVKLV